MSPEEKKAFILLKSLIFHYHGLDEDEERILNITADELDAHEELVWANAFIAQDYMSAFDRSREYLNKIIGKLDKQKRIDYLIIVWEDNNKKGYLTEMEATAMLNLAKDWEVEKELLKKVKT
ncbi:MAG: hypothetical protein RJQ09_03160 [Cyclobacteriaceae bacterium]